MRFFENGPSIPDELLTARDEGRVIFFCGAGVSLARAGLSDFFNLAEKVIQRLGVPTDSPTLKILKEAKEIGGRTGVEGLISADRIFGLLEREFSLSDIETEVAKTLLPPVDVDLTAHRILLDLAATPEGKIRLITTNFDRLFEHCLENKHVWQPPRLPDPSRHNEMDGVIHLHGRVNENYNGSDGDGFILTSSEFGRAYLSDGWATEFFREIINRYIVVFVGYSAGDPPIHYLLEALNKRDGQLSGVYAFQSGDSEEAIASWRHKGVEAITYTADDHDSLWETLEAWSIRAKDTEKWFQSIIDFAKKGPENLKPHERGQVAHIVSTLEGTRKFSDGDVTPPAEWLCVFDSYRRFAKPGYIDRYSTNKTYVDPFDLYGLDSDTVPDKVDPDDLNPVRNIPRNAWDAFNANRLDHHNLRDENFSSLRGHWSTNTPTLPSRLNQLGIWVSKIADHPTSVWWAANQNGLHPDIQRQIKWQLMHSKKDFPNVVHQSWLYLFEVWEKKLKDYNSDWYDLNAILNKYGWDDTVARKYAAINRPFLKANQNTWCGPKPPEDIKDLQVSSLIHLTVEYQEEPETLEVPDEWLVSIVRQLAKNLEYARQLETELNIYEFNQIEPIASDEGVTNDGYRRNHGLSGSVMSFVSLFSQLVNYDIAAAKQELAAWPTDDNIVFCRLRIWSCGNTELVSAAIFGEIFKNLSDDAFWDSYHQRDLLIVLAKRWDEIHDDVKKVIECRLINGQDKYKHEDQNQYKERKAWATLNRITWLANKGCNFTFDLKVETKKLRSIATDWKIKYAEKAAESMGVRSGWVRTDTEYSELLHEPFHSILSKINELSGKTDDFLVEKDPYQGLANEYPVRAFSVLTYAAKQQEYPVRAWRTFLNSESRKQDKPKFSALVAERIAQYPDDAVKKIIIPASEWALKTSEQLASNYTSSFEHVISKLINVLHTQPDAGSSTIVRDRKEVDWAMEALNAPAGKIAQAIFKDPRTNDLNAGDGFSEAWLVYIANLLSLEGDLHRHAIVIFSHNLNWFYAIDPTWTEANLLSVLNGGNDSDKEAFWYGFLWAARAPNNKKLFLHIKSDLFALAKRHDLTKRGHCEVLAGIILGGWGQYDKESKERYVSNNEMRDVLLDADDEFRSRILRHIKRWANTKQNNADKIWSGLLIEFLQGVWPRQNSVKTPNVSARLFEIAFSNANQPELIEIILPLLTTIGANQLLLPHLRDTSDNVVDLYPYQILALLHKVLPDETADWPYYTEDTLNRISEADPSLTSDERLLELQRKWNAR